MPLICSILFFIQCKFLEDKRFYYPRFSYYLLLKVALYSSVIPAVNALYCDNTMLWTMVLVPVIVRVRVYSRVRFRV